MVQLFYGSENIQYWMEYSINVLWPVNSISYPQIGIALGTGLVSLMAEMFRHTSNTKQVAFPMQYPKNQAGNFHQPTNNSEP